MSMPDRDEGCFSGDVAVEMRVDMYLAGPSAAFLAAG